MDDIQEIKRRMWYQITIDDLNALIADHDRLEAENAALAAWQCVHLDGKTGVTADEHGNQVCAKDARIAALEAALRYWDEAFATGRSEPLFIARDNGRLVLDKQPARAALNKEGA